MRGGVVCDRSGRGGPTTPSHIQRFQQPALFSSCTSGLTAAPPTRRQARMCGGYFYVFQRKKGRCNLVLIQIVRAKLYLRRRHLERSTRFPLPTSHNTRKHAHMKFHQYSIVVLMSHECAKGDTLSSPLLFTACPLSFSLSFGGCNMTPHPRSSPLRLDFHPSP